MKNDERKEVFRGHTEECLRHLGSRIASSLPKGSRRIGLVKRLIAGFCCVNAKTVSIWLNKTGPLPVGEALIKLMSYLDMVGYRIIELERMPKGRRYFAELIGFGLLSGEQAAELLGYATASNLYQVLQGHVGVSNDKEERMWTAWKGRKEELEKKKEDTLKQCRLDTLLQVDPKAGTFKKKPPVSRVTAIVGSMECLQALLGHGLIEKLSEDELATLRQSSDMVFSLLSCLNALGSKFVPKGGGQ